MENAILLLCMQKKRMMMQEGANWNALDRWVIGGVATGYRGWNTRWLYLQSLDGHRIHG